MRAPLPSASMAITEATPMMMPSMVRAARNLFAAIPPNAVRMVLINDISLPAPDPYYYSNASSYSNATLSLVHDAAIVHAQDALGMFSHLRVVCDQDDGAPVARQLQQQRH